MTETSELLVATRNAGKVREFASLLSDTPQLRIRGLSEFPRTTEVEETGSTFEENASLKARAYAAQTGLWTLADDSGLEVDALGGAPGVFSARYGGLPATDSDRTALLLKNLETVPDHRRRARFVCVIAVFRPSTGALNLFRGQCDGHIAHAPRGTHGFGYDPVFVPDGYSQTFGELPSELKHHLSHRARALRPALDFVHRQLQTRT
ncbi:MAG TPA: RdgB/HAM1 family non-canonical purine NTP pyrophosphatase [Pyrinomonadaceae bacterium]|jgi:XTP/dITP diphosphohydrolase